MSPFLIYGLRDPRTGEIRYVGQSQTGFQRPKRHRHKHRIEETTPHKRNWLRALERLGLRYEIVVLEQLASAEQLNDAEARWIAIGFDALGDRLLNATDGKTKLKPYRFDDSARKRMSEIMGSPEMRERLAITKLMRSTPEQLLRRADRCAAKARRQEHQPKQKQCSLCGATDLVELYRTSSYCRSCTRDRNQVERQNTCGWCGQLGHNRRKCSKSPAAPVAIAK